MLLLLADGQALKGHETRWLIGSARGRYVSTCHSATGMAVGRGALIL